MEVLVKYQQFLRALLIIVRHTLHKAQCRRGGIEGELRLYIQYVYVYTLHAIESQTRLPYSVNH